MPSGLSSFEALATEEGARQFANTVLREVYENFMATVLGIPVVLDRKASGSGPLALPAPLLSRR